MSSTKRRSPSHLSPISGTPLATLIPSLFWSPQLPFPPHLCYSLPMSIENLSVEQAIEQVRSTAARALDGKNLSLVLGTNGMSGRGATGNYSLLAKATGLSRVHIGKVLKGAVEPSHKTLCRLSEATGISVGRLSQWVRRQRRKAEREREMEREKRREKEEVPA